MRILLFSRKQTNCVMSLFMDSIPTILFIVPILYSVIITLVSQWENLKAIIPYIAGCILVILLLIVYTGLLVNNPGLFLLY